MRLIKAHNRHHLWKTIEGACLTDTDGAPLVEQEHNRENSSHTGLNLEVQSLDPNIQKTLCHDKADRDWGVILDVIFTLFYVMLR